MSDIPLRFSTDASDWFFSLALVALWFLLLAWLMMRRARENANPAMQTLVIYASQTGHASDLAQQAHLRVEASGTGCAMVEADKVSPDLLAAAETLIFIASTTGEGEAPDNSRRFESNMMNRAKDLVGKKVAILALGDRRYSQFCGFGRRIGEWARQSGAEMLFPDVELDDLDAEGLAEWDMRLTAAGFPAGAAVPADQAKTWWKITERQQVAGPKRDGKGNLASDGLFQIALQPAEGDMPSWEIGDLFELTTPDGHLRDYSIASLPGEENILLFVRRLIGLDGVGAGSGHLTDAALGAANMEGRIRSHHSFRPPADKGPLLAIGAGSGWAGLRPHLLHAMALGQPCRLIFGERAEESDSPILAEMIDWQRAARLDQLALALSRPQLQVQSQAQSQAQLQASGEGGPYVQDILAENGADIAEFLGERGCVVICGRLAMGERVLAELARLLGEDWLANAREEGRLLRDLY